MIKLLAVDMDGTCLNSKHRISEDDLNALREAAEAGIIFVPTTGRTTNCVPRQLVSSPFYRYVISSNGACVTDTETGEDIYRALIPCAEAAELLRQCTKLRLGVSVHADHRFILQGRTLFTLGKLCYGKDAGNTEYARDIAALMERDGLDAEEIQLFFFSKKKKERCLELLKKTELVTAASGIYAEVYEKTASKGRALAALADKLGIVREDIACIGDEENDISMFEVSGHGYAMGNGIAALKERAEAVLPDNDSSGVAYAVHNYILK